MRITITLLSILLISTTLQAQDLIVTLSNDSINARVDKIYEGKVYYTFKKNKELLNGELSNDSIKYLKYNYYATTGDPVYTSKIGKKKSPVYPEFRIAASAGWSFRVAADDPNLTGVEKEYIDELKKGNALELEGEYFMNERVGIGLLFNHFWSENSMAISQNFAGQILNGTISDKISINYFGPVVSLRMLSPSRQNAVLIGLSAGYTSYVDEGSFSYISATAKGSCFGISMNLAYDYSLGKHFSIGAEAGWKGGALSQVNIYSGGTKLTSLQLDPDEYESLGRVDVLLGLRIR